MSGDSAGRERERGRGVGAVAGVAPARDLAAEAEEQAIGRQVFVRHVFTRLPLVSAFVVAINLFVQVRGDVGLAVAIAQNLTFGAIAVIVLLNLVTYIMVGVMVALMPVVADRDFNRWTRLVSLLVIVLFTVVLVFTASWLLLAVLLLVFAAVAAIVRRGRRTPPIEVDRTTVSDLLTTPIPPVDSELRALWADGRAMLRAVSPTPLPVTPVEAALVPPAEPKTLALIADEWNERSAKIGGLRSKSLTRLAFSGIIGFVALFGLVVLTQPIRFAPLELVSVDGAAPQPGFVLLTSGRGLFVPDPFGAVQFITADQVTSVTLCDDPPQWWSISVVELVAPGKTSGVDCSGYR